MFLINVLFLHIIISSDHPRVSLLCGATESITQGHSAVSVNVKPRTKIDNSGSMTNEVFTHDYVDINIFCLPNHYDAFDATVVSFSDLKKLA